MNREYKRGLLPIAITGVVALALWGASILTHSDLPEAGGSRGAVNRFHTTPSTPSATEVAPSTGSQHRDGQETSQAVAHEASQTTDRPSDPDIPLFEDPTGDLDIYRNSPMSSVPHVVARGWGMGSHSARTGVIGAVVIVDPGVSEALLEQLVRDIQAYHAREDAVSIRIMNDGHAATYDRHGDGGALAQRHLVAQIVRNEEIGVNEMRIGDRILEP